MADNTIALGIRPAPMPDYNALAMQRANMLQSFAAQDAARQNQANAMLRQQAQDARQAQLDQITMQDRERQLSENLQKQQQTESNANRAQVTSDLINRAKSLLYVPFGQRLADYQTGVVPLLRKMGLPDDQVNSVTEEHLSDPEINAIITRMGGEAVSPRNITVGNRVFQEDPVTKQLEEVVGAPDTAGQNKQIIKTPQGYMLADRDTGTVTPLMQGTPAAGGVPGARAPAVGVPVGAPAAAQARPKAATPAQAAKEEQQLAARQNFSMLLSDVKAAYEGLNNLGAVTSSTRRTPGQNIIASAGASGPGQIASRIVGTRAQTLRDTITNAQFSLLNQIKNMEGIGARSLDSNVELKNALRSLADPTQSIESIRRTLGTIGRVYKAETGEDLGLGAAAAPAPAPAPGRAGGAPTQKEYTFNPATGKLE